MGLRPGLFVPAQDLGLESVSIVSNGSKITEDWICKNGASDFFVRSMCASIYGFVSFSCGRCFRGHPGHLLRFVPGGDQFENRPWPRIPHSAAAWHQRTKQWTLVRLKPVRGWSRSASGARRRTSSLRPASCEGSIPGKRTGPGSAESKVNTVVNALNVDEVHGSDLGSTPR